MDITLESCKLDVRLLVEVDFKPNVLVHGMLLLPVLIEVDPNSLKLFPLDVADEAVVDVVFLDYFLLSPHVSKGVNDDTGNDCRDDQIYEEHIKEVGKLHGHRDGGQFISLPSYRRTSEPVVDVHPEAVHQSIAVHFVFESIFLSDVFGHESPN